MTGEFRQHLYPPDHPRLSTFRGMDAETYRRAARREGTFSAELIAGWEPLYHSPFRGITENGSVREEVHRFEPARPEERAPVEAMVTAADALLEALDDDGRAQIRHAVDAVEWQTWSNPEFIQFDTGIRLERCGDAVRRAAMALLAASLSPTGYDRALAMMRINHFLGELVGLRGILNEFSYNLSLFGNPDRDLPWGWQLFGHHLALNCLVVDGRMVLSPVFMGAEPDVIDRGPHAGTGRDAFTTRVRLAVQLTAELTPVQRDRATIFERMVDPAMPPGRIHPGDERHLAGAFQDNRQIAFEGVDATQLSCAAQGLMLAIIEDFHAALPAGPRAAKMREVREYLGQTWFCWIGGHQPGDVFYYRIQSPVTLVELDHHCGVFLDYDTPQPFHIHTVLRTPHGNDYGRAYLRQWQERRR